MKIAVLIEDHYQILEVWYPYLRLREEGIETVFVGTGTKKSYESKEGYPAQEELSIKNINTHDFEGVIIPGGYAPDVLRRYEEINTFVKTMHQKGKLVAAICHAGWVLVSAGILKGKKATCFYAIKDDVVNAGAEFLDKEVVVDGNLITSRNPFDLPAFCTQIVKFLKQHR
ncbi:MAG: type 1 glutamine amidotransferase [Candidatus Jettenia sp.]|uniref:Peptidase n=1 Tax=Candidatus Jettenia caeni TaxID=247490 RepID=I3IH00_9BACT|nr:type 1 glutamine amidotransferase domain-containing protein [Candidatus Jettenia sp. AMX1]MBC6929049.1 type 1 glutamine amidotransferase [Candidatus Jettenia sp.]NUN23548.1 type 1 glutamine amidotransferase [Candidatus Jettenia caeni]KAA0249330.1 MAG: type 1 glutamine amidotransferase [Candidatus Jettenia sp. AMX1]MCE7881481.1 type 1 glutamine amidotransferase [Candidatus Jettenia sp. AMX1]MCQ3928032.1 type 1 glutamine amidotransferase [Candidatus Jettenia sp.]